MSFREAINKVVLPLHASKLLSCPGIAIIDRRLPASMTISHTAILGVVLSPVAFGCVGYISYVSGGHKALDPSTAYGALKETQ